MATISHQPESAANLLITLFPLGDSKAISIPKSAYSLRGFRDWALSEEFPSSGQYTFIDGELIIEMSPEYFETHNAVKTEITAAVYGRMKELQLGRFFSDRALLSNEEANISTEPDAMFVRYDAFQQGRCRILDSPRPGVAQELVGTPDWVLEIVSKSSIRKDKKLLRERYYAAGIGEYWLIDALGDDVDFQMLIPGKTKYIAVKPVDGWLASPIFGCAFRLGRRKEQDGYWLYTLEERESDPRSRRT
jgi:Uma2 family endonuclease